MDHGDRTADPGGIIPTGARVFVSTKPVDFQKELANLMALVKAKRAHSFPGALLYAA